MDYDERSQHLRNITSEADKAVVDIKAMLKEISEKDKLLDQLDNSDPSVSYIPLCHSKHRNFIDCITFILDIIKKLNHNALNLESTNPSRIKSSLQCEDMVCHSNRQSVQELERLVADLRSFYPALGLDMIHISEENSI